MTVAELIEELKKHDPNALVFTSGEEGPMELRRQWVVGGYWFMDSRGNKEAFKGSEEVLQKVFGEIPQGNAVIL